MSPSLACWACSYLINEPFTRMEQIAAYISLFGVVLIARPVSLLSALSHSNEAVPPATGNSGGDFVPTNMTSDDSNQMAAEHDAVTPAQRGVAVGIAMLGVFGSAGAYTTLRWIGQRAHPLISVNYFATWCTIVSVVAMLAVPGVDFLLPRSFKDWSYLIFLGICGFVMVSIYLTLHCRYTSLIAYSNSSSQPAFSTRNLRVLRTWCTCKCSLHLHSTS